MQEADAQIVHTDKCPKNTHPAVKVEAKPEPEPIVEEVTEDKPKKSKKKKKSEESD